MDLKLGGVNLLLLLEKLTLYQIIQAEALTYRAHAELIPLLSAFAKPHINSCIWFWARHFLQDGEKLEGVQERAVRVARGLENVLSEERLQEIGLCNLT